MIERFSNLLIYYLTLIISNRPKQIFIEDYKFPCDTDARF